MSQILSQGAVEGINLTPTLMFDYPTVPDLVEYIWSQVRWLSDSDDSGREDPEDPEVPKLTDTKVGPAEDDATLQGLQASFSAQQQL